MPNLGTTLKNLTILQLAKNEFEKAKKFYKESSEIYQKLAEVNPQTYLPDLAMMQITISLYCQENIVDKKLAIQSLDEALINLLPFSEIPYIQNYLNHVYRALEYWGINVEAYLIEKGF